MKRKLVLEWAEVCLEGMVNNLVIQWNIAMQMDWPLTELGLTIYCLGVTVLGCYRERKLPHRDAPATIQTKRDESGIPRGCK